MSDRENRANIPNIDNVAWFEVDHKNKQNVLITKDMLTKQLKRDGPKIASSFDEHAYETIELCSELIARSYGAILRHLVGEAEKSFETTVARLIATSINYFTASVEVARHGYPLQYGMLARGVHETLAVVLVIGTESVALEDFHAGRMKSTKCITKAKKILPHLGKLWGWFSDSFVHIGTGHASLEMPKVWSGDDDALDFVVNSMRHDAWLIYVVVELVFYSRFSKHLYWKQEGAGFVFSPDELGEKAMDEMLMGQ